MSEVSTQETTEAVTPSSFEADTYYDNYMDYYEYDEYMYPGYDFERALYLYVWEIVVVIICLVNVIVITVLLRRKMRNATNMILAAIAISDSLTGLVTLPTYIMVYQRFDPIKHKHAYDQYDYILQQKDKHLESGNYSDRTIKDGNLNGTYPNYINFPHYVSSQEAVDGYTLTKNLCEGFMVSKYFISKSFHTVSIFLTLFLAIQRYVSVAFPYKSQFLFNTTRTLISCAAIFILSPLLHIYHLTSEKAMDGLCQWDIQGKGCGGTCIYLWVAFFLRHFLPCITLVVLSVLFISQLRVGEKSLRRMDSNSSQISRRADENRRISIIVTAIVVVFLVPEIPYSIFLLYNAVDKSANDGKGIQLKTNRAIQLAYEVGLVLSFHANFYIYMMFNKRFRKVLYRTVVKPVRRLVGDPRRLSITRTSSTSHAGSARKAATANSKMKHETKWLNTMDSDKSSGIDTKTVTLNSFTSEKLKNALELEPLDSKRKA